MEFWVPLLSALVGALIGSITSIVTIVLQSRREEARHLRATAVSLALAEHTAHLELAKEASRAGRGPQSVPPIATYFAHQLAVLSRASQGDLTPQDIIELNKQSKNLTDSLRALAAD